MSRNEPSLQTNISRRPLETSKFHRMHELTRYFPKTRNCKSLIWNFYAQKYPVVRFREEQNDFNLPCNVVLHDKYYPVIPRCHVNAFFGSLSLSLFCLQDVQDSFAHLTPGEIV